MGRGRWNLAGRAGALLAAAAVIATSAGVAGGGAAGASTVRAAAGKPHATPSVITWAENADESPNWIFPFASLVYYSSANLQQFQYLMYRPLYWLGDDGKPALNTSLSLAGAPVYSDHDHVVTIPLKGWKWSNGTTVDAQDVVFFMNLLRSEKKQWAGYVPAELPDNVTSVTAPSATSESVSITFDRGYNTTWMLFNELSQITPLPLAWDISKLEGGKPAPPGSGGCSSMSWNATTTADCQKVWKFMTDDNGESGTPHEAGDYATYATNPLWQVVDGPWRMSAYNDDGAVTMVPNSAYSGSQKPQVSEFDEVPYVSDASEYDALAQDLLSVGYLPIADAKAAPKPGSVGPNPSALAGNYDPAAQFSWLTSYFPINFNSTGDAGVAGAIFHQLYIRQALQELVDQPKMVRSVFKNYATPDDGPVPTLPVTTFLSSAERHNPYPYELAAAEKLLTSHGWTVTSDGTDVCSASAGCGSGVPEGSKLSLDLVYTAGNTSLSDQVADMQATWSAAGVHVTTKAESIVQVLETAAPCKPSPSCTWEMADWGGGWIYQPDIDPTGEYQFQKGAGSNVGSYSDAKNDQLITKTITSNAAGVFDGWENYLTDQAPVVWQPAAGTIVEFSKSLQGVEPLDPFYSLTPEYWHFTS